MVDPIKLAQQYHDDLLTEGVQRRVEWQLAEDEAELPTFWQGIGEAGQHTVQRVGHQPIEVATSLTSGGLAPGQQVDAAYSDGFVAIDHTPFIAEEQTTTLQINRKPSIQLLFANHEPLNPTGSYTSAGDTKTQPGGDRLSLFLKINNRAVIQIGQLTSQSQNLVYAGEVPQTYNTAITPSRLTVQSYILIDQTTSIIQVQETWETAWQVPSELGPDYPFDVHNVMHTFVLRSGAATYYSSEDLIVTYSSPTEVLFVYPSGLSGYQNYLYAGLRSDNSLLSTNLISIPVLGQTEENPGITNDQVRFFYKFRQLWVQVLSTAGTLLNATTDPGWQYFFTNQKYQVATKSTINSNRIDTTYPGFQALKISAAELQTMAGLALDSIIYRDRFQDAEMLGVVADTVIPGSDFNTSYSERTRFYYGADGEFKSWLQFEAVRGVPEVY